VTQVAAFRERVTRPIAATIALEMIGPIPGTLIKRSQPTSRRARSSSVARHMPPGGNDETLESYSRIEIVRYSDRDFDIYQTARERRLGLGPDSTLLQPI
jgi:hypothetical protein